MTMSGKPQSIMATGKPGAANVLNAKSGTVLHGNETVISDVHKCKIFYYQYTCNNKI